MAQDKDSPYLTPREAAAFLRLKRRTLANMRHRRTGPHYRKHGGRIVYSVDDLKAWSSATRRRSEHDAPPPRAHMPDDFDVPECDDGNAYDPGDDAGP
jgi:hypothetical protein